MARINARYTTGMIRLSIAVFFFILGIVGIMGGQQESFFSLDDGNHTLELVFGIIELVCAVLLLLGIFTVGGRQFSSMAGIVVFILWLIRIGYSIFFLRLFNNNNKPYPNLLTWLLHLSVELVIAAAIFSIVRGDE
jgi:uncharacterized membrane protein YwaF